MAQTDTRAHLRKVAEDNGWSRRVAYKVGANEVDEFVREAPDPSCDLVKVAYVKRGSKWVLQWVRYRENGDLLQLSGNLKAERAEQMLSAAGPAPGTWSLTESERVKDGQKPLGSRARAYVDALYRSPEGDAPGLMPAQPPEYRVYAPHPAQKRWVAYGATASETEAREMLAGRREESPGTLWVAARVDITELDW